MSSKLKATWYYVPLGDFKYKRYHFFCWHYDSTFKVRTFRLFGLTRGYYGPRFGAEDCAKVLNEAGIPARVD